MKILVSACLVGRNCKYSGGNNINKTLVDYLEGHEVIEVCPEVMGGLSTPRSSAEICNGRTLCEDGRDVSAEFALGAKKCLQIAIDEKIDFAILQTRSPSCGKGIIYDGSFKGVRIVGDGIFVRLLEEFGFLVYNVENFFQIVEKSKF